MDRGNTSPKSSKDITMNATGFDEVQFSMVGCCEMSFDQSILTALRPVLQKETWNPYSGGNIAFAKWSAEDDTSPPSGYTELTNYVDRQTELIFGTKCRRHMFSLWEGGEPLPWHNHVDDGELRDVYWMIYLGDDVWKPEAGGRIEAKSIFSDVVVSREPTFGTVLLLNNQHPGFLHRVTAYNPISRRIAIQMGYEFSK
jgi:hypothetical protein